MADVIDLNSRRPVLGHFHARATKEDHSLERDGQPYVALKRLDTADPARDLEPLDPRQAERWARIGRQWEQRTPR